MFGLRKRHGLLPLSLLLACGGGPTKPPPPPPLPPEICHPVAAPPAPLWSDISTTVGLGPADAPTAQGTSVFAGDLDGDGYLDLLSTLVTAAREKAPARYHFLLMNRPHPSGSGRSFVDTTKESGVNATRDGMNNRGYTVAHLGDLDNDGDLDVVTCPGDPKAVDPCVAMLNDGQAHFVLAPASDLEGVDVFPSVSGTLVDLDRDGRLDFWPGVGTAGDLAPPLLFRGLGDGKFKESAEVAGLPLTNGDPAKHESYRRNFGVTACDLDSDGDQDVILADYGREANQVWINEGAPGQLKLRENGQALGVAFDDRKDFSDDESYRCYCQANPGKCPPGIKAPIVQCPNRGWYPGSSDQPYRLGGNTFGIACGDLDNDGDRDLMTAEIVHWDVGSASDPSELLINQTPAGAPLAKFVRPGNDKTGLVRGLKGGYNAGDMMPVFVDVDLDGLKDVFLTTSDYPDAFNKAWLWRQQADHTFQEIGTTWGLTHKQPHGVAFFDFDNDGDLDVVLGTSTARGGAKNSALRLYRNNLDGRANQIQIELEGRGAGHANRSAVGAQVKVTAGGVTQLQEVQAGHSHEAVQSGFRLTFGLGAACAVDEIEVRWPDGAATVAKYTKVRANYRVQLIEGDDKVHYVVPK